MLHLVNSRSRRLHCCLGLECDFDEACRRDGLRILVHVLVVMTKLDHHDHMGYKDYMSMNLRNGRHASRPTGFCVD